MFDVFRTKAERDSKPYIIAAFVSGDRDAGLSLGGGCLSPGKLLTFGEHMPFEPNDWIRLEKYCPCCCSTKTEREDYCNPCASAACKLNGVHTYHLGCGSQHRDVCANCGTIFYDSAEDEIENTQCEAVEYICSQCEADGIQPGHFACGQTYWIPV